MDCAEILVRFLVVLCFVSFFPSNGISQVLPGTKDDLSFDKEVSKLDLEDSDSWEFHRKTGGTSIGFKISKIGGRNRGLFLPRNSSTDLEGEVVSYRLSCLLGVSEIYNPVTYYNLGPKAIARFKSLLGQESNEARRKNLMSLRYRINKNPNELPGIYKYRSKRDSQPANILIRGNRLNTAHPLAKWIRGNGERPPTRLICVEGVVRESKDYPRPRARADVLARQLSIIFCIDMMTGQWDRFSGGNLEMYAHKDGVLQFVARDNGGASLESNWSWFNRYKGWVSRFDRSFAKEARNLNSFIENKTPSYRGFTDQKNLFNILGFRSSTSISYFKKKLSALIRHMDDCEKRYGDKAYF